MGQKVNPIAFRTGIMIGWKSRWYASKQEYADLLVEDHKIRDYVKNRKDKFGKALYPAIAKIEIERTRDEVKVILFSARPGILIGRKGERVEELQKELQDKTGRRINIKIEELNRPELVAQLVAEDIAEQLIKRSGFRRTMKRSLEQTMEAGARGSRSSFPAGWEGRRCRGARNRSPVRSRCRRCGRRSTTASPKPRSPKATSASRYGSIKAPIARMIAMALMPKRVKHRKSQRGRIRGDASRGNRVVFGDWGLQAVQGGWVSAQTLEAGRIAAQQYLRTEGRLYIRVFPHKPITSIPLETRMGKGKGEPEYWAAVVKPGTVLFEIGGISEEAARMCFARLAHKMPVKVRLLRRRPL